MIVERWCRDVAEDLSARGLRDAAWQELAPVLARAPSADGIWPCRAARRLLEQKVHPKLEDYLHSAKWHLRGLFMKGPTDGGAQEREIAARFRQDETALRAQGFSRAAAVAQALAEHYDWDAEHEDIQRDEFLDP